MKQDDKVLEARLESLKTEVAKLEVAISVLQDFRNELADKVFNDVITEFHMKKVMLERQIVNISPTNV
jgi:SMC interacting uncharacterized protein involved in chromosome segregation